VESRTKLLFPEGEITSSLKAWLTRLFACIGQLAEGVVVEEDDVVVVVVVVVVDVVFGGVVVVVLI
jgi:hypothetical protein